MSKEKTFEEIEQENYDKMLDAMVTYNQATDRTLTFNTDKEREQYKQELSASLDKLAAAETNEEVQEILEANKDNEVFNAAASFAATQMKPEEYVVRGALLKCSHGSHHRKLNLPKCHGVYIGQNPVMHSGDCNAGIDAMVKNDINITSFGVCNGTNSKPTDTDPNISLAKEVLDENGHPMPGEISDAVVRGVQCKACIQNGTWENAHKSTKIGEDGHYALTTNSFLVCQHGGVIMIVTSGQEHIMSEKDYGDKQDYYEKMGYTDMMESNYGFSPEESSTIRTAYELLLKDTGIRKLNGQEKIHFIFSKLSSLCDNYDGGDGIRWKLSGDIPSTDDTKLYLKSLGMSEEEVLFLYETINRQHKKPIQKDFAHELVQYAIFADDSFTHNTMDGFIGKMNALGSYKGDVYSARMGIDDMNSDVDATNIYNRMIASNQDPLEIMINYNTEVEKGKTNRVDEFLSFYGNGDISAGLEYIKEDLMTVDMGAHYIQSGVKGFIIENIQDGLFTSAVRESGVVVNGEEIFNRVLDNRNVDRLLQENHKLVDQGKLTGPSIIETMEEFIKYLEEGMSK